MSSGNQHSNRSRGRHWIVYMLVGLSIASGYAFWEFQPTKSQLFGFQPPGMNLAQHTPKDVIGDLGGMKVRIPRHYAEYVEYDDDPGFGEKRKESIPERNFKSKLRSFGMNARFPDMKGLETIELKEARRNYRLKPENPWIDIGINAGSIYPGMGANANSGLAKKLWEKSEYWFANYERAPRMDTVGLDAYVVAGADPRTGKPARESDSTDDIYIHKTTSHVDTFISCGRTSVPGGVATCHMHFGLEPKAKVRIDAGFSPALLPKWHSIRNSVSELIYSFEVRSAAEE
ncbi:MAG: hypothetical protein QM569_08460 [Acidovorax sp.]|uniref:hypothetical protein n=1 Tax=Acidovorax sp. TaxID=1872122 RepID=UPI0039E5E20E